MTEQELRDMFNEISDGDGELSGLPYTRGEYRYDLARFVGWLWLPVKWIWRRCWEWEATKTAWWLGWTEFMGQDFYGNPVPQDLGDAEDEMRRQKGRRISLAEARQIAIQAMLLTDRLRADDRKYERDRLRDSSS